MQFKVQERAKGKEGELYKRGRRFGGLVKRSYRLTWDASIAVLTYNSPFSKPKKILLDGCFISNQHHDPKSETNAHIIALQFRKAAAKDGSMKILMASSESQQEEWCRQIRLCCSQSSVDNTYDIDRDKPLGAGVSGTVYRAIERSTGASWAIKEILKKKIKTDVAEEAIKAEAEMCKLLKHHNNIVNMKEFIENDDKYCIVMECVAGGDLVDRIVDPPGGTFTEADASILFDQFLNGLEYLHSHNVAHRDLKLDNILLTSKTQGALVKIADFGTARVATTPTSLRELCGTVGYIAPEVVRGSTGYGLAADIWSAGVVLYTLLAAKVPFTGKTDDDSFKLTLTGAYEKAPLAKLSESARAAIAALLVMDPESRPTASAARLLPWVSSRGAASSADSTGAAEKEPHALSFAPEVLASLKSRRRHCIVASRGAIAMSNFRRMTSEGNLMICTVDEDYPPPRSPSVWCSSTIDSSGSLTLPRSRGSPNLGNSGMLTIPESGNSSPVRLRGAEWLPPTPKPTTRRLSVECSLASYVGLASSYRRRSDGDREASTDTTSATTAFSEAELLQATLEMKLSHIPRSISVDEL